MDITGPSPDHRLYAEFPYVISEQYRQYLATLGFNPAAAVWPCDLDLLERELGTALTKSTPSKRYTLGAYLRDTCAWDSPPWNQMDGLNFLPEEVRLVASGTELLQTFGRPDDEIHLLISGRLIPGTLAVINSMKDDAEPDPVPDDTGMSWIEGDPPPDSPWLRLYHVGRPVRGILDRMPSVIQITPESAPPTR